MRVHAALISGLWVSVGSEYLVLGIFLYYLPVTPALPHRHVDVDADQDVHAPRRTTFEIGDGSMTCTPR